MDLVVGTNTYITVDECIELINDYYGEENSDISTSFTDIDEDIQRACVYRSFLDMQRLPYRGSKKEENQKTAFPRVNKFGYESDEDLVKLAQAVNAMAFMPSDSTDGTTTSMEKVLNYGRYGLKTYKLGSFSVSMNGKTYKETALNTSKSGLVEEILREWLRGSVPIR